MNWLRLKRVKHFTKRVASFMLIMGNFIETLWHQVKVSKLQLLDQNLNFYPTVYLQSVEQVSKGDDPVDPGHHLHF